MAFVYSAATAEFVMGLWSGWPSWALNRARPARQSPAEWIGTADHSTAVAVFDMTNVAFAWPAALMANRLGRRGCLLAIGAALVGSFGVLFAPGPYALFVGRALAGIAKALSLCTTPAFLAEIARPEARGRLNVVVACCDALGMLAALVAGPRCPYAVMNGLSLAAAVLFLVAAARVPETPAVLMARGRPVEAQRSHHWYQPSDSAADRDVQLARLRRSVRSDMAAPGTFHELFTDAGNRVALALVLAAVTAQRGGGITCVVAYSTSTLPADGPVVPDDVAVAFAAVRLTFTVAAMPLIDRFGRRPLLIGSHAACAAVCAVYSWSLYVADGSTVSGWTLSACVIGFVVAYSVGAGAVPGALLGEMFPANVKSRAVTVVNITSSFGSFLSTASYLPVREAVGAYPVYGAFCVINATWAFCAYLFLFETNGMSLSAIQYTLDQYGTTKPSTNDNATTAATTSATTAAATAKAAPVAAGKNNT